MTLTELTDRSHVPYSGAPALAVTESAEGAFFAGVAVENLILPLSISPLQGALFSCLSEGHTPKTLYSDRSGGDRGGWVSAFDLTVEPLEKLQGRDLAFLDCSFRSGGPFLPLLENLTRRSVVPCSGFPVSAIIETDAGCFAGVNVECRDAGKGLCAERVALARAVAGGATRFHRCHLHTRRGSYSSPCGACRQLLIEHLPEGTVELYHPDGTRSRHRTRDLLPHNFHADRQKREC